MEKGLRGIWSHLEEYMVVAGLTVMTAIAFVNVVSRYFLRLSFSFMEELTVNLFVWVSLFGSALAARKGAHLGLSVVTDHLPEKAQKAATLLIALSSAAFYVLLLYLGIDMVRQQMAYNQISSALNVPEWILGLAIPVGCACVAVRFVEYGFREWLKEAGK